MTNETFEGYNDELGEWRECDGCIPRLRMGTHTSFWKGWDWERRQKTEDVVENTSIG